MNVFGPHPRKVVNHLGALAAYVIGDPELYLERVSAACGVELSATRVEWGEVAALAKVANGTGGLLYDADCTPLDPRCPVPGLEWQLPGVEVRMGDRGGVLVGFVRPHGYARVWYHGTGRAARELVMPEALFQVRPVPPMELPR